VKNIADVTGGKPIAVLPQSIPGVSAINPLVAFYGIHGRKRELLFFYFVPDTTRDLEISMMYFLSLNSAYDCHYKQKGHIYVFCIHFVISVVVI
jgi:hypothetical protein